MHIEENTVDLSNEILTKDFMKKLEKEEKNYPSFRK